MRRVLWGVLLLACGACQSSAPKPDDEPTGPGLQLGAAAPPILAEYWLDGPESPKPEPGTAYVYEFWATWCGPCLAHMPHVAGLGAKYKDAGLRVIAVTTIDERGNTVERIKQFASGRLANLGLTFAICTKETTAIAYMKAGDSYRPLPTSVVIDKAGKVAFIGFPDDLDEVLPAVLDGSWKGKESATALKKLDAELDDVTAKISAAEQMARLSLPRDTTPARADAHIREVVGKAATTAVAELDKFAVRNPRKATTERFRLEKISALMLAGEFAEAKAQTESLLAEGAKAKNWITMQRILDTWATTGANPRKLHGDLAVRAADEMLKIEGDKSPGPLMAALKAYGFAGEKAKAREFGEKALELVKDPRQQKGIEQAIAELGI